MVDTHCHLYLDEFKDDIDEVILRALDEGIDKFYLPAIDSGENNKMLLLVEKYPKNCFAMMGLHPCSVKDNYKDELQMVADWLSKKKFFAVGEIGLDFYWDKTYTNEQYYAFHEQIELALHHGLPIVIHTRNAMQETINVVKKYVPQGIKGIFHCFGGTLENAKEIINAGFYLGIGGVVTYKKAGLDKVLQELDLNNIVLETDAPYLSPTPFRGKRNESSYLKYIVEKIAELKGVSVQEVARITTLNAQKIFGF